MTDTTDHQDVLRREAEAKAAECLAECEAKVLGLVEEIGAVAFQLLQHVLAQALDAAVESEHDLYMHTVNGLVAAVRDAHTNHGDLRGQIPHIVDALGALSEATEEMELAQ
jgi:fructose-specific phosphotransferase system IIC component